MNENLFAEEIFKKAQSKNLDISLLINKLRTFQKEERDNAIKEIIAANQSLVGKYFKNRAKPHSGLFPECWKYYKVISAHSENCYRVECLVFYEYPFYWFDKNYFDNPIYGSYNFNSFYTRDFLINTLQSYTEITADEYWLAAKKYLNYLSLMEWPHNHYRQGNTWPHELKWKEEV